MRIRTTGTMMVERSLETMRIDDSIDPISDAKHFADQQLIHAAAQLLDGEYLSFEWPVEWRCLQRVSDNADPRQREKRLALAAALLIREIDRLEHLRLIDHISGSTPQQSNTNAT